MWCFCYLCTFSQPRWYAIAEDEPVPPRSPRWPDDITCWYLRCTFHDSPRCSLSESLPALLQAHRDSQRWSSTAQLQPAQLVAEVLAMADSARGPPDIERLLRDMFSDRPPPLKLDLATSFVADMKSAPSDSLLATLAVHSLRIGSLKGVLLLWFAFVREVRWCWHHLKPLPSVPVPPLDATVADFSACLLYQKLQMLGYCIAKKQRDAPRRPSLSNRLMGTMNDLSSPLRVGSLRGLPSGTDVTAASPNTLRRQTDPLPVPRETAPVSDIHAAGIDQHAGAANFEGPDAAFDAMREGAREPVPGQFMLSNGRAIWSPDAQEHGLRTEDQVQEHERLLESLGTTAEAAATRARLQSASLESDMAAFKAANPGATLEDFVRWHSPRDWIEDTSPVAAEPATPDSPQRTTRSVSRGKLSTRMMAPNNLWGQVWTQARACPVSRQRPLFNVEVEAEKALHYLETLSPAELFEQLLRVLASSMVSQFSSITCVALPSVKRLVTGLAEALVQNLGPGRQIPDNAAELLQPLLYELEVVAGRASSLMNKFEGRDEIAARLLAHGEDLRSASDYDRRVITRLFTGADTGFFGEPDFKEFICRALLPRPVVASRRVANRMCVTVSERDSEYRVATLLSLDE